MVRTSDVAWEVLKPEIPKSPGALRILRNQQQWTQWCLSLWSIQAVSAGADNVAKMAPESGSRVRSWRIS
jgi:hypothetical protein